MNLPISKPSFFKLSAKVTDAKLLLGPEEYLSSPKIISPRRAVPVVTTTALAANFCPVAVKTPTTRPSSTRISSIIVWRRVKLACFSTVCFISRAYRDLSA